MRDPVDNPVGLESFDPGHLSPQSFVLPVPTRPVDIAVSVNPQDRKKPYIKPDFVKPRHSMVVYSGIIGLQLVNADRAEVETILKSLSLISEVVTEVVNMRDFTLVGRSYVDANVLIPARFDNSYCNLVVIIKCKDRRYNKYMYVNDVVVPVYEALKKAGFDVNAGQTVNGQFQSWKDHYKYWSDSSRYGTAIK